MLCVTVNGKEKRMITMLSSHWDKYVSIQASIVFAILISTPFTRHPIFVIQVLGAVLFIMGFVISIISAINLGSAFTTAVTPKEKTQLAVTGIYSIVRHPIYSGVILLSIGWSLFWGSILSFLFSLIFIIFFDFKAKKEERLLSKKYEKYADYKKRVKKKLIPFIY